MQIELDSIITFLMNPKNFSLILLGLALLIQMSLSLFLVYPAVLQTKIRGGLSWVYLPTSWKGARRFFVTLFHRLWLVVTVGLAVFSIVFWFGSEDPIWLGAMGLPSALGILFLSQSLQKHRFRQQENAYFLCEDILREEALTKGQRNEESFYKNLASYQHQSILREAEANGTLRKVLAQKSREFRLRRKRGKQSRLDTTAVSSAPI